MARPAKPKGHGALYEAWARWLADPSGSVGGSAASMLARWMDAKGFIVFGSGGGSSVPAGALNCAERRIEVAVYALGKEKQIQADVLRLEYDAGSNEVVTRLKIRSYSPSLPQIDKALCLGLSLRTYVRHLTAARAFVERRLGVTP